MTVVSYTETRLGAGLRALLATGCPWPVIQGPFVTTLEAGVAVTVYPITEDEDGSVLAGVNVHIRGPVGAGVEQVNDEAERIRVVFDALRMTQVQNVPIAVARRDRATPPMRGLKGAPERIDTWHVTTDRLGITS